MQNNKTSRGGFTLAELMMASAVLTVVSLAAVSLFVLLQGMFFTTTLNMRAASRVNMALNKIVYGAGTTNAGIRGAAVGRVSVTNSPGDWVLVAEDIGFTVQYDSTAGRIANANGYVYCENVATSTVNLAGGGCEIAITVEETGGGRTVSNEMSTFVMFRN